jgi:phosphomannomutase
MTSDSLKFGTSGLRGLVTALTGAPTQRYVGAYLRHLKHCDSLGSGIVFIGHDLRASSPAIAADCAAAIAAFGCEPIDCGALPTPALALYAMARGAPAIMVTGSHIPDDRNGLKFYTPKGEIGKADETGILRQLGDQTAAPPATMHHVREPALAMYLDRYAHLLPEGTLSGLRIGNFAHSSVARDILGSILERFGAEIVTLGPAETFVAVDTEAFDDAVFAPLPAWLAEHRLNAIVSTDGDGDRPLMMDERGRFVRGDALGMLTAAFLDADTVVTPVTSNSAIETSGLFNTVIRTQVGSPFVIAGMEAASGHPVIGFEANGGTLLGSQAHGLSPLPTRDAVLPILAALGTAAAAKQPLSQTIDALGLRPTAAGRLKNIASERSSGLLANLADTAWAAEYFAPVSTVSEISTIDGTRVTLASGAIVHYRPSGNAPELRCYVEAHSPQAAQDLLSWGLARAQHRLPLP